MTNSKKWYENLTDNNKADLEPILKDYEIALGKNREDTIDEAYDLLISTDSRSEDFLINPKKENVQKGIINFLSRQIKEHIKNIKNGYYELCLAHSNRRPAYAAEIIGLDPKYKFDRKFLEEHSENGCKIFYLENDKIYNYKEDGQNVYIKIENYRSHKMYEKELEELLKNKEI